MPWVLNLIYLAASLFLLPMWLYQMVSTGQHIEGLWQKFAGAAPLVNGSRTVLWCHAVSTGEVLLLRPLLERLRTERPDVTVVLSTFTRDGYAVARASFPDIEVFYAPLDLSWSVRRAYRRICPQALLLSELELWPNLLLEAGRRGVPVVVVNSRINDQDYRHYRRINFLHRRSLSAIRWWGAQTSTDAERITSLLGPGPTCVEVVGSLKYEGAVRDSNDLAARHLRDLFGFKDNETVLVAGSTHAPEERIAVEVFRELQRDYPTLRLVLVPRSRARCDEVARCLATAGVQFVRRSGIRANLPQSLPVTLVDTVGELPAVWQLADLAFVGGSLAAGHGGQNMIEPAACGVATCFGPDTWNFREVVAGLLAADAAVQVNSADDLRRVLALWCVDPQLAAELGRRARRFAGAQTGAVEKTLSAIRRILDEAS